MLRRVIAIVTAVQVEIVIVIAIVKMRSKMASGGSRARLLKAALGVCVAAQAVTVEHVRAMQLELGLRPNSREDQ